MTKLFKVLIILTLMLSQLTAQDVTLTFIGNEGIPLDSVKLVNLNKDCDTILYGITISFNLKDANLTSIPEIRKVKEVKFLTVHDLTGKLLFTGNELQFKQRVNTFWPTSSYVVYSVYYKDNTRESIKLYTGITHHEYMTTFPKLKSKSEPWSWVNGDYLQITGYATGYFTEIMNDNPSENELYVFDFQPSITGVANGHIFHDQTLIPVIGVNVSIAGVSSISDSSGYYEIDAPIGYHALYATKEGYDDYGTTVNITTDSIITNIIEMTSDLYTYTVNGYITTLNLSNNYGTSISICNPDSTQCLLTYTDSLGYFEINNVPPGLINFHIIAAINVIDTLILVNNNFELIYEFIPDILCIDSTLMYEGQEYNLVQIGNQCWFSENLNVGEMILSDTSQTDNSIIEKFCYDNNEDSCNLYGGLYQWDEMMNYLSDTIPGGICPPGWRVPTDFDFIILEGYVDSEYNVTDSIWYTTGSRGYDVGKKLKSIAGWKLQWNGNGNGTNQYGFNAYPSGTYWNGEFQFNTEYFDIWTSSNSTLEIEKMQRFLSYSTDKIIRNVAPKNNGLIVRCIKN